MKFSTGCHNRPWPGRRGPILDCPELLGSKMGRQEPRQVVVAQGKPVRHQHEGLVSDCLKNDASAKNFPHLYLYLICATI
jgi:hypothetical protein